MDKFGFRNASAFHPDEPETSLSVSILTASVLGALIAEQLLDLDSQPGETIELTDRTIAAAIERVIHRLDAVELDQMRKAHFQALANEKESKK